MSHLNSFETNMYMHHLPVMFLEINECASNPCQNTGTCLDKVAGFTCMCQTEFTGTICESKLFGAYTKL